jgi:hypothetical protein
MTTTLVTSMTHAHQIRRKAARPFLGAGNDVAAQIGRAQVRKRWGCTSVLDLLLDNNRFNA